MFLGFVIWSMVIQLVSPWKTFYKTIIFWVLRFSFVLLVFYSQHKYIMDLLEDVGMLDSKGSPTPMTWTTILTTSVNDPQIDGTLYRRVIDSSCTTYPSHILILFSQWTSSFNLCTIHATLTWKESSHYFVIFVTYANMVYRFPKLHILVWLFIQIQIGLVNQMISLVRLAISLFWATHQFPRPPRNNTPNIGPLQKMIIELWLLLL